MKKVIPTVPIMPASNGENISMVNRLPELAAKFAPVSVVSGSHVYTIMTIMNRVDVDHLIPCIVLETNVKLFLQDF